jgi:hypothetical protein
VTFLATGSVGKEPDGGYKYHNDQKKQDETADAPPLIGWTP